METVITHRKETNQPTFLGYGVFLMTDLVVQVHRISKVLGLLPSGYG